MDRLNLPHIAKTSSKNNHLILVQNTLIFKKKRLYKKTNLFYVITLLNANNYRFEKQNKIIKNNFFNFRSIFLMLNSF